MTGADLVEIRSAVERALAGSKVTAERITVLVGREPYRIELELRGTKDNEAARRACVAVSRMVKRASPGFYEIAVEWAA